MSAKHYFAVRYGDIVVLLYHENMQSVRELLFENSRKEKTLKRFLEYCYMIDVKVAFEGLNGEKTGSSWVIVGVFHPLLPMKSLIKQ